MNTTVPWTVACGRRPASLLGLFLLLAAWPASVSGFSYGKRQFPPPPGLNLQFQRVPTTFDPTSMDYWEQLILVALIGVFIAMVCLLSCIVFLVGRYAFNSFGGRAPSSKGYTPRETFVTRVIVVACAVGVTVACSAGYTGNDLVSSALDSFFNRIADAADEVNAVGQEAYSYFLNLGSTLGTDPSTVIPDYSAVLSTMGQYAALGQSIATQSRDLQQQVATYTIFRWMAIFFCFEFAMLACAVGVSGAFFRKGSMALVMALLGFFVLFLAWVVWAIHFPSGIFVNDLCEAVDFWLGSQSSSNPNSTGLAHFGLNYFANCVDDTSNANAFDGGFRSMQDQMSYLNRELQSASQFANVSISIPSTPNIEIPGKTSFVLSGVIANISIVNQAVQNSKDVSAQYQARIRAITQCIIQLNEILSQIAALVGCSSIRALFEDLLHDLCDVLLTSLNVIQAAAYGVAIGMTIGVVFAIRGFKRFERKNVSKGFMCPVEDCGRWFRFRVSYVIHLRLCRQHRIFGAGFNFLFRPIALMFRESSRAHAKSKASFVNAVLAADPHLRPRFHRHDESFADSSLATVPMTTVLGPVFWDSERDASSEEVSSPALHAKVD